MPRIEVLIGPAISSLEFRNDEEAHAAYRKIKDAVEAHDRFANRSTEVVEVDTIIGTTALKVESIITIVLDVEPRADMLRRHLQMEVEGRALREEMGLPPLRRGE
jgi:hypothetical protein